MKIQKFHRRNLLWYPNKWRFACMCGHYIYVGSLLELSRVTCPHCSTSWAIVKNGQTERFLALEESSFCA
jgi:hypothetical protein